MREHELDEWENDAMTSLVLTSIDLDSDLGNYANGQHRALAMMDQRATHAIGAWNVDDDRTVPGVRRFAV